MTGTLITTRSKPRRSIVGTDMTAQNSVRAYRCSPEDVMIQIRREKDLVGVALTFDEARLLGRAILDAAWEKQ